MVRLSAFPVEQLIGFVPEVMLLPNSCLLTSCTVAAACFLNSRQHACLQRAGSVFALFTLIFAYLARSTLCGGHA